MNLIIPPAWRFGSPGSLDRPVINAFEALILDIAGQADSWSIIELFKRKLNPGCSTSSSESWAISDLLNQLLWASENGPKFVAAFCAGCGEVAQAWPQVTLPDIGVINAILADHEVPYEIQPPNLVPRDPLKPVAVQAPDKSLDEKAHDLIRRSLGEAERLLLEQRPRPAVQEILWLLETVSTGFQGVESGTGSIEGKYFNEIVRDLRRHNPGTTMNQVLSWVTALHGFLSSPTGGGVRHGTQLAAEVTPTLAQAHLYCNLTKSYINYLLAELANLRRGEVKGPQASGWEG